MQPIPHGTRAFRNLVLDLFQTCLLWPHLKLLAKRFPELNLVFNVTYTLFPLPGFAFPLSLIGTAQVCSRGSSLQSLPCLVHKSLSAILAYAPPVLCKHQLWWHASHGTDSVFSLPVLSWDGDLPAGRTASKSLLCLLTWPSVVIARTHCACAEWMCKTGGGCCCHPASKK